MTVNQDNGWDIRNWGRYIKSFLQRSWPYCIGLLMVVIVMQGVGMAKLTKRLRLRQNEPSQQWQWPGGNLGPLDPNGRSWQQDPFQGDFFGHSLDANTWDPFQEMQRMQQRMDAIFGDSFGKFTHNSQFGDLFDAGSLNPRVDIKDKGDCLVVKIDLPGADDHNVNITCTKQALKISGTFEQQRKDRQGGRLLRQERSRENFSRSIPLPVPVQPNKMKTKFDKGVVTVTIPKAKP